VAPGGVQDRFLVKDYSISCNSTKYKSYLPFAMIALFLYAIVFPAVLAYYVRKQLLNTAGDLTTNSIDSRNEGP
jgi:hypothetical protein